MFVNINKLQQTKIMNFNSKIKSSFNTILFIEIYYITREGTVFQFQNTVNIVTN